MNRAEYAGETDTNGLSVNLWKDCAIRGLSPSQNAGRGVFFFDDFYDLPTGKYTATQATAGTFLLTDAERGVAVAAAGSTTATQGINVQLGGTAGEIIIPSATRTVWGEARLRFTASGTGPEFFWGLSTTDTTVIASSALSSTAAGFKSVTDDNVVLSTGRLSSTEATGTGATFVDSTWYKIGFKIVGLSKIEYYVNGVLVSTNTTTGSIPNEEMRPTLVCQSSGTTSPTVQIDWHAFGAY